MANLAINALGVGITGGGFDLTAANNVPWLSRAEAVTASSPAPTTSTIFLTFTLNPVALGPLYCTMYVNGIGSGNPVKIADVVAAPTITTTTTAMSQTSPTVTITGTGFNATSPALNIVTFTTLGAAGTVIAATATSLTVQFTTLPTTTGTLTAKVNSFGGDSNTTDVASVGAATGPFVNPSTSPLPSTQATFTIFGGNFNATPANNTIAFSSGAVGSAGAGSTTTFLVVTLSVEPTSLGPLTAIVTDTGTSVTSGGPVQVAAVQIVPVITPDPSNVSQSAATLVIVGTDLGSPGTTSLQLSGGGAFTIGPVSATSITVTFTTLPPLGVLTAVVTVNGVSSASVTVATIIGSSAPTVTLNTATVNPSGANPLQISIVGTNFDVSNLGNNTIALTPAGVATPYSFAPNGQLLTIVVTGTTAGAIYAVVTTPAGNSGAPVQIATIGSGTAPTVTMNPASIAMGIPVVVTGTGFSGTIADNSISLDSGVGIITAATTTSLTIAFLTQPNVGPLSLIVGVAGLTSGPFTQIATVVTNANPIVLPSTQAISTSATSITITGANFDPTAANNTIAFNLSAVGTVTAATTTSLTVTFSTPPTAGTLTAVVTTTVGNSGSAVDVAVVSGISSTTVYGNDTIPDFTPGANYILLANGFTSLPNGTTLHVVGVRTSDGSPIDFVANVDSSTGTGGQYLIHATAITAGGIGDVYDIGATVYYF